MSGPEDISPRCPRCGYDLSGHTATWASACPLDGMCSECGLEFSWREVLVDRERFNYRHVEHCERRAIPIAAARTLLWCAVPWIFWKRVKLRHEPRVGRMVLWLVLVLVASHMIASAAVAIALWRVDAALAQRWNNLIQQNMGDYQRQVARLERQDEIGELTAREIEYLNYAREWLAAPPRQISTAPELRHLAKAIGYPFAFVEDQGASVVQVRGARYLSRNLGPYSPDWDFGLVRFWGHPILVVGAIFSLAYPLMVILLPATRRRLKIRSGHLARAGVFSMSWLVIPPAQRALASTASVIEDLPGNHSNLDRYFAWADADAWPLWCWIVAAWISLWWLCAIWRGLRFPSPVFHWLLLTIPGAVLTVAVLAFTLGPLEINALIDDVLSADGEYGFDPEALARGSVDRVP